MKTPKVTVLVKYLSTLKKIKKKYVTSELLSKYVGVYPEVINETFSYFDPMVNMDYQYNLMDLVDQCESYLNQLKSKASEKNAHKVLVTKKKLEKYESIADFIYQKMTIGGIVDRNIVLSDVELRALKRLISDEQALRKQTKKKQK